MSDDFVNSVDYIASWIIKNPDKAMLRISEELAEAEQRGYRRGVQDALVRCDMELHNGRFPFDATRTDAHDRTAMAIRNDILALLEQTTEEKR